METLRGIHRVDDLSDVTYLGGHLCWSHDLVADSWSETQLTGIFTNKGRPNQ